MNGRLLAFSLLLPACARPAAVPRNTADEQEITRLENAWREARVKGDIAFLESLYAREMRIQGTDGSVIPRDTDIALFATGRVRPEMIDAEEMHVAVYGNSAVVTGRDHIRGTYKSVTGEGRLRFTDVFVRRDGRWQLVSNQGTWIGRPVTASSRPALIADLLEQISQAETKILGLADAMPDSAYDWRPMAGVRSTREVLVHIAGENYYAAAKWGGRTASETGVTGAVHGEADEYEKRPHSRAQAIAALQQSFGRMRESLGALPESGLEAKTEYARQQVTVRTAWVRTATHVHEHLGQLIAYARSNRVVPPWSR